MNKKEVFENLFHFMRCYLAPLFLFLISCNPFHKEESGLIIKGSIPNTFYTNGYIYFFQYPDTIRFETLQKIATDSAKVNEKGEFSFAIKHWNHANFFDLKAGSVVIARNFFAEPNESFLLDYVGQTLPLTLKNLEGIGKHNLFLQNFSDTFFREPTTKQFYYVGSNFLLAPDYAKYINKRREDQLSFYEKYSKGNSLNDTFTSYMQNEINYQWANDKLAFLWKKRIRNEVVPLDTTYFDFLKIVSVDNPKALNSPAYTRFIYLYIREMVQQESNELYHHIPVPIMRASLAVKLLKGIGLKFAFYDIYQDELTNIVPEKGNAKLKYEQMMHQLRVMAFEHTQDSLFLLKPKSN